MIHVDGAPCVCGHARMAHEHYRAGTDCAVCPGGGCPRYRGTGAGRAVLRLIVSRLTGTGSRR